MGAPRGDCVPNAESARTDDRKFTEYLLNPDHPDGGPKARYFAGAGFTLDNWEELRDAILAQLPRVEGRFRRTNAVGLENWEATMKIAGPERVVEIVTYWEIHPTEGPKFLTAYPV
jgi:hypothetical protein